MKSEVYRTMKMIHGLFKGALRGIAVQYDYDASRSRIVYDRNGNSFKFMTTWVKKGAEAEIVNAQLNKRGYSFKYGDPASTTSGKSGIVVGVKKSGNVIIQTPDTKRWLVRPTSLVVNGVLVAKVEPRQLEAEILPPTSISPRIRGGRGAPISK